LFTSAAIAAAACGSTSAKTESSPTPPAATAPPAAAAPAPAPAPATEPLVIPAATTTAAPAPASAPSGTTASSASPAPGAASPASGDTPETVRRRAQIQWALRQDEIKNDPHGQWAVAAKASSSYNDAQGTAPYAPSQATGVPNVEAYTNNPSAWRPKTPDAGIEWLELTFANPVHATSVRIRESYGAGAVIKVELFDAQGAAHVVWSGIDPTKDLDYFTIDFPRTAYATARVKLTLATNTVPGFKQIDAVQLVGTAE
jgi:hypothetical protein